MAEKARSNVSGSGRSDARPAGPPDRTIPPNYTYDATRPTPGVANVEYRPTSESTVSSNTNSFPHKQSEHSLPRTYGLPTQCPPQLRSTPSRENIITAGREWARPDVPERSYSDKLQSSGSSSPPTVFRENGGYPSIEATSQRPPASNAASNRAVSRPLPTLPSGGRSRPPKPRQTPDLRSAGNDGDNGRRPSSTAPKAKKVLEKKVLENVLGIYPAENKLPPGRSVADEFMASIAKRFPRGRKNSASQEDSGTLDSKSASQTGNYYQPWSPDSVATGPPVVGGAFVAELPGSEIPPPFARSSSQGTSKNYYHKGESYSEGAQGGSRSQSVPKAATHLPAGRPTEETYANPAPLIVLPAADGNAENQSMGQPMTADMDYGVDIAEWAESFYSESLRSESPGLVIQAPKPGMDQLLRASLLYPEGAVYGEAFSLQHSRSVSTSRTHSRSSSRSTMQSSSSRGRSFPRTPTAAALSDSGGSTSHASSIDAFQYETCDTGLGLGTIGEDDGFYGDSNDVHDVNGLMGALKIDSQMDYNYGRDYRNSFYDGADDLQIELELEAVLAMRRKKLLAEKAGTPVITPKCALDAEIEAYLAERKKAVQPVEEKQDCGFELEEDVGGGNWGDEKVRPLRTKY